MMLQAPASASTVAPTGPTLRDIHLPPEPSWWPPAPGWWLLGGLLLILAATAVWLWRRRRRLRARRRHVMDELDRLVRQHVQDGNTQALAGGLHQLLRRVARPHDVLAVRQRGEAWRKTLARVPTDAETLEHLLALDQAMYRAEGSFDPAPVVSAVRRWLCAALKSRAWRKAVTEHDDA